MNLDKARELLLESVVCCDNATEWVDPADMFGRDHSDDCDNYDGAPLYRDGMGPNDPVRCDND